MWGTSAAGFAEEHVLSLQLERVETVWYIPRMQTSLAKEGV